MIFNGLIINWCNHKKVIVLTYPKRIADMSPFSRCPSMGDAVQLLVAAMCIGWCVASPIAEM